MPKDESQLENSGATQRETPEGTHDGGQAKISFEIKEITRVRATVTGTQQRIGCRFTDIPPAFETNIQRYMQDIEIQQKNLA